MDFPTEYWSRICTNNLTERVNREIRRRTRAIGAFPDGNSALMLVCARLRHVAASEWGSKRYMDMEHLFKMEIEQPAGMVIDIERMDIKIWIGDRQMELKKIEYKLTVCKVADASDIDMAADFYFVGKTDEEVSLVCRTEDTPAKTVERDDGWRGFRIQGVLDFSLIGILSKLSGILAEHEIGIFAISTYNTDYILVKEENFARALSVLAAEGYHVV